MCTRESTEGTEPPMIPIPTAIPDFPGIGDGGPIPDLPPGDRGSIPTAIPDLPESGIRLSTIEYCTGKGVEFRLPKCLVNLKVNCTAKA